jgi:hypothetical protein
VKCLVDGRRMVPSSCILGLIFGLGGETKGLACGECHVIIDEGGGRDVRFEGILDSLYSFRGGICWLSFVAA